MILAACGILKYDDKYCVCKRFSSKGFRLEFPMTILENGETLEDALEMCFFVDCGIPVQIKKLLDVKDVYNAAWGKSHGSIRVWTFSVIPRCKSLEFLKKYKTKQCLFIKEQTLKRFYSYKKGGLLFEPRFKD